MTSEDILSKLRKIIRALNLESKRVQKEFGISIPQLLCLTFLSKSPSFQANLKELAQALNLNPSTITGIVSRLEKKGFLARLPKGEDKRVSCITLTETGARLLENTPKLFHETLDERLKTLPQPELDQIKTGLAILIDLLGVAGVDAAPMLAIDAEINDPL